MPSSFMYNLGHVGRGSPFNTSSTGARNLKDWQDYIDWNQNWEKQLYNKEKNVFYRMPYEDLSLSNEMIKEGYIGEKRREDILRKRQLAAALRAKLLIRGQLKNRLRSGNMRSGSIQRAIINAIYPQLVAQEAEYAGNLEEKDAYTGMSGGLALRDATYNKFGNRLDYLEQKKEEAEGGGILGGIIDLGLTFANPIAKLTGGSDILGKLIGGSDILGKIKNIVGLGSNENPSFSSFGQYDPYQAMMNRGMNQGGIGFQPDNPLSTSSINQNRSYYSDPNWMFR